MYKITILLLSSIIWNLMAFSQTKIDTTKAITQKFMNDSDSTLENKAKQTKNADSVKSLNQKFMKDAVYFNLTTSNWDARTSSYGLDNFNPSAEIGIMKNIALFNDNHFAIAFGLSISWDNLYSKIIPTKNRKLSTTEMIRIPDTISFSKNKITTNFLEIPIEFRYHTKSTDPNKTFRMALGFKISYLVNSFTKYNGTYFGEDPSLVGETIKVKNYNISNIENFRYGLTAKFGYGKFALVGFYSLTPLFVKDRAPAIYPFNMGISFTPY